MKKYITITINVIVFGIIAGILIKIFLPYYIDKKLDILLDKDIFLRLYIYETYQKKSEITENQKKGVADHYIQDGIAEFKKSYPFVISINQDYKNLLKLSDISKIFGTFNKTVGDAGTLYYIPGSISINSDGPSEFCIVADLDKDFLLKEAESSTDVDSIIKPLVNISTYNKFLGIVFGKKDICMKMYDSNNILVYKKVGNAN